MQLGAVADIYMAKKKKKKSYKLHSSKYSSLNFTK